MIPYSVRLRASSSLGKNIQNVKSTLDIQDTRAILGQCLRDLVCVSSPYIFDIPVLCAEAEHCWMDHSRFSMCFGDRRCKILRKRFNGSYMVD